MLRSYLTLASYGESEISVEKSTFIAFALRITEEREVIPFIEGIRKTYWDASHHCYAYRIGEQNEVQKASDDGEPSGTAGKPILEVIKNLDLQDTLVVVTRYFGGVKLGTGGLIRAYGQAAKKGIQQAGVIARTLHREIIVSLDYSWHGKLEYELHQRGYSIAETSYLEQVTATILAPVGQEEEVIQLLTNSTNAQAHIRTGDTRYVDEKIQV